MPNSPANQMSGMYQLTKYRLLIGQCTHQTASEAAGPGLVEAEHRGLDMEVTGPGLAEDLATLVPHLDTDHVTIGGKADL